VQGLWLVWRYQGPSSLEWFLRRRDALALLAGAILGEESVLVRATKEDTLQRDCAVVQVVIRQLLESLQTIHATGQLKEGAHSEHGHAEQGGCEPLGRIAGCRRGSFGTTCHQS
jgi:hypothetical protein